MEEKGSAQSEQWSGNYHVNSIGKVKVLPFIRSTNMHGKTGSSRPETGTTNFKIK